MDFSSFTETELEEKFNYPLQLCIKFKNFLTLHRGFDSSVCVTNVDGGQPLFTAKTEELILIMLRLLVVPHERTDVAREFRRSLEEISAAEFFMSKKIYEIAQEYLDGRASAMWSESKAQYCAGLVNNFDLPLQDVCLFVTSVHEAMKAFLAVSPMGLVIFVSECCYRRSTDTFLARSYLYPKLNGLLRFQNFDGIAFGEASLRAEHPLHTPYIPSNAPQRLYNKLMSSVSTGAEGTLQLIRSLWPVNKSTPEHSQDMPETWQQMLFFNRAFLTNIYSCFFGINDTAMFFNAEIPKVEEYLGVEANSLD